MLCDRDASPGGAASRRAAEGAQPRYALVARHWAATLATLIGAEGSSPAAPSTFPVVRMLMYPRKAPLRPPGAITTPH